MSSIIKGIADEQHITKKEPEVHVPGYGTIPLDMLKRHVQSLSKDFDTLIQQGAFLKAAYRSEQFYNALMALAKALPKPDKVDETHSTGTTVGSAGIGGGAGLGIDKSPIEKVIEKPLGEGELPPKAGFNKKPHKVGPGTSKDDYEYKRYIPRDRKEKGEEWAIARDVRNVNSKLGKKKSKELDTGFYKNYLSNRPVREGEVVSLQARKTPLVVAGSPYDWDIYDLRNNKMVASVIGGDRSDSKLYEIRIKSSGMTDETRMPPTYLLTAGPNDTPPYKAYELVVPTERDKIEKSPGPGGTTKLHPDEDDKLRHFFKIMGSGRYYGYDVMLVEKGLDQWDLIEKALGAKIMDTDDAMELGYTDVDPEDSSGIVYLGNQKNEGIITEYDNKTIDSVVQRLPKGLTVNNFTHPAFKEFLYQKYYAKVKADWDKLYPFFAQEYKQKHGIKEYKQDPHRIVSGDSDFFDDMLVVIPKGLSGSELYKQAFKEFLYNKFANKEWTDFKKNRYTYWDAYQKIDSNKPKGFLDKIKSKMGVDESLPTSPGGMGQSYRKFTPKSAGVAEGQLDELKKSTINDYLSKSSAALRGGRQEVSKKVPSWKVAAGKVNPNSEMGKYAKIKASDVAVQEEQAPMFTPEEKMVNANDPRSDGWRLYKLKYEQQLDEKCWDTHKQVGMKKKGGKMVPNCIPKESAIMKGIQSEEQVDEYKEVPGQRKIEFSKENPPDLYYLYQQFIQRMLNPENTIDPNEWISKVNDYYGLNYSWKDYQKRGHSDHTDNWQRIVNRYIVGRK